MADKALNVAFAEIRNYLAGKAIGITRDSSLMHEVVKCLFCRVNYPDLGTSAVNSEELAIEYSQAFERIKSRAQSIFLSSEQFLIDPASIHFIHQVFSEVDLEDPYNDPLSELYQTFVGSDVRGTEGQFFTPTEAVSWLVNAIAPSKGEKIIDPACGAGSFLSYSARYMKANGVAPSDINASLYGIEKDDYLSRLANTHIALATFGESNVVCADSIERKGRDGVSIPFDLDGEFDVVLANPPFGSKIKIGSEETKKGFDLAHKWSLDKKTGKYTKTDKIVSSPTPQILFVELCIRLLKPGGRMGLVVPESMLSSSGSSHVVQYLLEHCQVNAVAGMPENLFKTSGKGGTHTKTCLILATKKPCAKTKDQIFMAEAKWCGHDSRGNNIPHNDLPLILDNFKNYQKPLEGKSYLGYYLSTSEIKGNVLAPRYYNPEPSEVLKMMERTHDLICLGDLVDQGIVEVKTGDEVGKLAYGTGTIPFVRTSDISNWELKTDPKHGLSEEIYDKYVKKQDVRAGDILMVKDGTYLIGTCAYVTEYDEKIVYQSHLYKIRVKDESILSPYLLLAALSSKPVVDQIQSKRFTQDIIDSIGKRIFELILPIPKDIQKKQEIDLIVKTSIKDRVESRELARKAKISIAEIL